MKYLTILRHAKSSWADAGMSDRDRPLNDRGKNAIPIVGKLLQDHKLSPDLVISSPANRAFTTAAGISGFLHYKKDKMRLEETIYSGNENTVFELLQNLEDIYKDVFLFGHEPTLSSLIQLLSGTRLDKFSTCSAYRMAFEIDSWADLKRGSGKCEFYVNPKGLSEK